MIRCDECPRCKDAYPGRLDRDGYHFHICGISGNIVYTAPHRIKRATGRGYISEGISSCGLCGSVEEALSHMTEPEIRRWTERRRMAAEAADREEG